MHQKLLPRRAVLSGCAALLAYTPCYDSGLAAVVPPGFEPQRVEGIGGGADVLSEVPSLPDVVYPPFLNGTWLCKRTVTSVDGDAGQASGAWRLLGGSGDIRKPEEYATRFIPQPSGSAAQSIIGLDGRRYFGVILDRGFEMDARVRGNVKWDARAPNQLSYARDEGGRGSAAELAVVRRQVELPSEQNDKGWGSTELVRIATAADAGVFGGSFEIFYAAQKRVRWRRAVTDAGERVVEGLEIVKTFRVLDGVAGVEYPTSTTKSLIRLTRLQ